MRDNSNLFNFTESQTRALISSLHYIAQKNSGSIPVSSLSDSAEIVAYCAGFNSWKDMKQSLRILKSLNIKQTPFEHPEKILQTWQNSNKSLLEEDTLIFPVSRIKDFEQHIKLKSYPLIEKNNEVASNYQSSTGLLIGGSYFNENFKYEHIYHLNPQNTICFSERKDFFQAIVEQVKLKGKHHIIFTNDIVDENHNNEYVSLKLDPLNEIYFSDHFDILFSLNYDENSQFDVLWSLMVKDYISKSNANLTPSFLKYSLTLEFLSFYMLYLKKNKNPLLSLLIKYLHNIGVSIKENSISYSQEAIQQHLDIIKDIQLKVIHLEDLYLNGTFAVSKRQSIYSLLKERTNLKIFVPNEINDFIQHVYNVTMDYSLTQYDCECEKENYDNLEYQVVLLNSYDKLFTEEAIYHKNYSYHIKNAQNFSSLMENFPQIIFAKNNKTKTPPQDWLIKFYTNTEDVINLFAFQNKMLQELNDLEAYLWQRKEKHPTTSLDVFNMFLINPYFK